MSRVRRPERLYEMLGVDLTAIDGISVGVALTIASEIGHDVRLPQREGVLELAGPRPQSQDHRGKDQESEDPTGSQPDRDGAADGGGQSAAHADGSGAFGRRMRSRVGSPKAITAIATSLQAGVSDAEAR